MGLGIGLLGVLAISLPGTSEIEEDLELAWLFQARGPRPAPSEVVVIALDAQSAHALNLPSKPSEWPRSLHGQLVERLARAGARLVCFDLTFDAASRAPENDVAFAEAMTRAGNVVLVDSLRKRTFGREGDSKRTMAEVQIEELTPPIPILEQAALAHAAFPLPKDSRLNAYWTFKVGAGDRPTLPVLAFQIYAFDAYRDFLALLRRVEPSLALDASDDARALVAAVDRGGVLEKVRRAFLRDPELVDRVLRRLEDSTDTEITPANKRLIRSLVGVYRASEVAYLNLYGPARSITTIPYSEVLSAEPRQPQDPAVRADDSFRGKVVFVGYSASSQPDQDRIRDDYRTVFSQRSGLDISGVEIAATAFANLLEDRPVRPVAFPVRLAIIGFWGFVLGAACRMLRPSAAAVLVLALSSVYLFVAVHEFGATSVWLPLLIPLAAQAPLALFGGTLLNYRDAKRERKHIREAFGRFVPEKIVDRLVENVGPVGAADQLVYGACLATDLEKYTLLAEAMSPAELGALMNEYYAELFKPVERLGGVVNEVVGDAMLAIWAAPSASSSVRSQACEAALQILEALEHFNRGRVGKPSLNTRFGLHSGQLLLGSIGASKHFEYQAVGDMVNTASRIEGLSKYLGTRILVSEATVEGLTEFLTRPVGSFLLAGKSSAIPVVELGGRTRDANPRTLMLYERFAGALESYHAGRWRDAVRALSEILKAFPEDGPSRFFLARCEAHVRNPPDQAWDPTVRLEHK